MRSIGEYSPLAQIRTPLEEIAAALAQGRMGEAERVIAQAALALCDQVEAGVWDRAVADEFFTLLEVYVTDNYPGVEFSEAISELVLEGMHFHHYGESYGPDCEAMRAMARGALKGAHISVAP